MTQANAKASLAGWWRSHVLKDVDHPGVVATVHEDMAWSGRFVFMVMMSAGIAIFGLLLSSSAVVIGAMLISPLMGPIMGLGFGIAMFDFADIKRALLALVAGSVLAILFCALIVLVSPLQTVTSEIALRTRPNLFDLGVAIFSGLAGAYATIRGRQGAIVGVALAVALMPPLSVVGFGLAIGNLAIAWGAGFLFLTNLMAIAFSVALLTRLYGFGSQLSPRQTWLQATLAIGTFAALAAPLGLALHQIAWETVASRQARGAIAARFAEDARVSQLVIDYDTQPIRVRAVVFTAAYRPGAEAEAGRDLRDLLGRPVEVAIEQVRIGDTDAEARQLAEARGAGGEGAADRIAERLALVAGVPVDRVLLDRDHRLARVRAAPLPGAGIRTYRQLEARAATGEGWTIQLVPPAMALPDLPRLEDPPSAETEALLADIVWAAQRMELPVRISGPDAEAIAARLESAAVDARAQPSRLGVNRLAWVLPMPDG
ncbi:MAG TPA: DUF389 domain-containing protein [Allosphingosinicella sp.]|nr:DUF389 domain-containing protein [Allosphingosinicella sp.]